MLKRFVEYAAAFEGAYASRDFSALEPFFTEDAVYETQGEGARSQRHEGRDEVLRYLEWITEHFDRRFARRQILRVDGPNLDGDRVQVAGVAVYTLDTGERCHLSLSETATFRGDRIALLSDTLSPGGVFEMRWIVGKHADRFSADVLGD